MESKIYPNLIIAGAPKCGTSSLYFWLAAHPEACASRSKETFFFADEISKFNSELSFIKDGFEAYSRHFMHCKNAKIVFEATAPYIYYQNALEQLAKLPALPKIIFIVREPASRAYSEFAFNKYKLQHNVGNFTDYVGHNNGQFSGVHVAHGMYANYIKKWQTAFGAENVYIIQLEKVMRQKVEVMQNLAIWLGISADFYADFNFTKRNETFALRNKRLHQLGLKVQERIPIWLQEKILPIYQRVNATAMPAISAQEKTNVNDLKTFYKEANRELKSICPSLDLSLWE